MYSESIKTEGVGKGVTPRPRSGLCLRDLFIISVPFHYKILKKKFLLKHLNQGYLCICENKGTDQLRSNCKADQCLCFCYMDSTIPLKSVKF